MDYVALSKLMAYALRHAPHVFELELDEDGWVPIPQFLDSLRSEQGYGQVTREDLERVISTSSKSRYEISGDRIRALYGHSIPQRLRKEAAEPPEVLYHGTVARALPAIRREGLKPMVRQYVHLSVDTSMASTVGRRRGKDVVVLGIRAGDAARAGIVFYRGNEQVWLADLLTPEWLVFPENR